MKRLVKIIILVIVSASFFLGTFYCFWLYPKYVVPILMYHRFGYENNSLFVTPENFSKQMAYLKRKNYNVLSLDELVEGIKNKRKFRHRTVVITIDDGYKDNYVYAYPILKRYDFPATIFLITNFIERKKDFMNWEEVKAMLGEKISFGAHTKNHIYLPSVMDKEILIDEIFGSKSMIEKMTGMPVDYFCYPVGGFTEQVKVILKEAGYKGACTTNRGFARFNKDVFELKRIKVTNSDMNRPFNFWAKLSGYYNLFRRKRGGY